MRLLAGMTGAAHAGWDMTAVLAMGRAMGLPAWLVAEVLPEIELVAMTELNKAQE